MDRTVKAVKFQVTSLDADRQTATVAAKHGQYTEATFQLRHVDGTWRLDDSSDVPYGY